MLSGSQSYGTVVVTRKVQPGNYQLTTRDMPESDLDDADDFNFDGDE